jgi:hypothetical protein
MRFEVNVPASRSMSRPPERLLPDAELRGET